MPFLSKAYLRMKIQDQQQADLAGMKDAEMRFKSSQLTELEVYDQYQEIKSRPLPSTYTAPAQVSPSPVEWSRLAKAAGVVSVVGVSGYTAVMAVKIVVVAVLAWVEQNALIIGAVAATVVGFVLAISSFSGRRAEKASGQAGSGKGSGGDHYYYQYNNFGGNANQQNAK